MKIKSFAKINLGLEVIKKREDNYHDIRTLFQSINLWDTLEFIPTINSKIYLEGDDESIPWNENNLIFKAALLLKNQFAVSQGMKILARKKIPPGKGLGGGSSNAAMTLFGLNKIWNLQLKKEDLTEIGKTVGADVPYFLEGGLCLGLERGDKIIPLPDLDFHLCLLVLPSFSISTPSIYEQLRFTLTSKDKDSKINGFLTERELAQLENRLEDTIFSSYPRLKIIKNLLSSLGSELSLVSGTGAAVFGLFQEKDKAERGLEMLTKEYTALLVETVPRESYWNRLSVGV